MLDKIKVLVVDDSAFMRKVISDIINRQPDMQVVNTAKDGDDAIDKAKFHNPDVITLDVEMPRKNGLEALKMIKKVSQSEVIMLSSLTSEGSSITIEALREGAFDFIQKPSGSISLDIAKIAGDLVEKVRYAREHRKKVLAPRPAPKPVLNTPAPFAARTFKKKVDVILIGASTGGPRVVFDIITKIPANINAPVLVVQHMPAGFTKAFAERINKSSNIPVVEAKDGDKIISNKVYIAPGGFHMLVGNGIITLDTSPQIHGVRPAVDKLFISASTYFKEGMVACICTGMGKDGAAGVREVKSKGGYIITQDEATSTVYGMPKAAYETGCVDIVLPDNRIANEIIRVTKGWD